MAMAFLLLASAASFAQMPMMPGSPGVMPGAPGGMPGQGMMPPQGGMSVPDFSYCDEWGRCHRAGDPEGRMRGIEGAMWPGNVGIPYYSHPEVRRFLNETEALRREITLKRFEYFEAVRRQDTSAELIFRIQDDLRRLMSTLYDRAPFSLK